MRIAHNNYMMMWGKNLRAHTAFFVRPFHSYMKFTVDRVMEETLSWKTEN